MSNLVACPKCGTVFDAADPRIRRLSPATFHVWESAPLAFRRGGTFGPSDLASYANLARNTVYYHLRKLEAAGLVTRIPQRLNGHVPVRHVYAGVPAYN